MPEPIARVFGLSGEDNHIIIEHHDEGISLNEIPFTQALWDLKDQESKRKKR